MSATSSPSASGRSRLGVVPVDGVEEPGRLVAEVEPGPDVGGARAVRQLERALAGARALAERRRRASPRRASTQAYSRRVAALLLRSAWRPTDRRETDSGIEVKPVYTAEDVVVELELPGRVSVHPRALSGHVPRPAVDDPAVRGLRLRRGDERALPLPARARPDRPLRRLRPADAARLRLGRPARGGRGRAHGRRDRLDRRHGAPLRRDPARRGLDVDDDQRAGGAPAAALRARRRGAGRRARAAARHRPERHPQGVLRARELHLPAAAVDADHDRPVRVLRRAAAALEHDLDLRLPHPRGGLDGGAGARVHARERDRVLRRPRSTRACRRTSSGRASRSSSTRTTTSSRRSRSSARRGGSGRGSCATASAPRTRGRSRCASTRRRAARRSPRSSRRTTSCASRSRRSRRCAAARSRSTRTGSTRRSRCRPSARRGSRCARSSCSRTRPAERTPPTRSAARTSSRR